MAFWVGTGLAIAAATFARLTRFDRDRAFYPMVLILVASFYILFAAMGGSMSTLVYETAALAAFACLAVVGFRTTLWFIVAGLAAHGLFDLFRPNLITNTGVPTWWPMFCSSFDLVAAGCLALFLTRAKQSARA